jgi:hypothetical protein
MESARANLQSHKYPREQREEDPDIEYLRGNNQQTVPSKPFCLVRRRQKIVYKQKASVIPILLRLRAPPSYSARHGLAHPCGCR